MGGTVLETLHVLILSPLCRRYCYCLWFTDKRMEAQRGPENPPRSHSNQRPNPGFEPWESASGFPFLTTGMLCLSASSSLSWGWVTFPANSQPVRRSPYTQHDLVPWSLDVYSTGCLSPRLSVSWILTLAVKWWVQSCRGGMYKGLWKPREAERPVLPEESRKAFGSLISVFLYTD